MIITRLALPLAVVIVPNAAIASVCACDPAQCGSWDCAAWCTCYVPEQLYTSCVDTHTHAEQCDCSAKPAAAAQIVADIDGFAALYPQCFVGSASDGEMAGPVFNIDAGFNRGHVTRVWQEGWASSPLCVLAFEPNAQLCAEFAAAQEWRGASAWPVLLQQAGVSDAAGTATLWFGKNQHGKSMDSDEGTIRTDLAVYTKQFGDGGGHSETVRLDRIGDYLAVLENRLPSSTIWGMLKTDIQGADMQAMRGAGHLIERFQCISMEVWGIKAIGAAQYESPIEFMESHGFLYLTHTDDRVRRGGRVPPSRAEVISGTLGRRGQVQLTFLNRRPQFAKSFAGPYAGYSYCQINDAELSSARERGEMLEGIIQKLLLSTTVLVHPV